MRRPRKSLLTALPVLLLAGCGSGVLAGCGSGADVPAGTARVAAAESFWGNIASQLAGSRAPVHSIIVNPAQDPHSYEETPADARTVASSNLAIVNGVGYDPWMSRLVSGNPVPGRIVLNVGDLLGLHEGDNPHRWYSPTDVERVANAITADLKRLDPHDAGYFNRRHAAFETSGLRPYHALIAQIRRRYGDVPVGASESIFALQAPALGLRLITPPSFMKATSEGTELSPQDIITAENQIQSHAIKVWIYNAQNATPEIEQLNALARANHIPIATVTETLSPQRDSFERWQVAQLTRIERALHEATGR
jgi:zinc/manganese transport system substrate-binding protein